MSWEVALPGPQPMSRMVVAVSKGEWMCSISTNLVIGTDMGLPWVASWAYDAAVLSQSVAFTSNLGGSVVVVVVVVEDILSNS